MSKRPASKINKPQQHQGHTARKRFGQNFLVDDNIIADIVSAINPQRNQDIVEIGPGLGALTAPVLACIDKMHVVELDRDLVERLQKRYGEKLTIHAGDALRFDFDSLKQDGVPLRIIGNLPYNISSPLLFHLADYVDIVTDQHFMLQKEVVERMVAEPGSKAFSRLSVMLQVRYQMEMVLDVPPTAFNPPPKVDSAIVRMVPWTSAQREKLGYVCDLNALGELVTTAFSQRRKVLRNTLADYKSRIDFEALGFDLSRRAEEVSVAEYVQVLKSIYPK